MSNGTPYPFANTVAPAAPAGATGAVVRRNHEGYILCGGRELIRDSGQGGSL